MLVRVGNSKDVAKGQMRVFDVAGAKVNVASADGHLYAFDDTCTHQGCSLASGELDGSTVTCACHGSQFDVTSGAVLRGTGRATRALPGGASPGRGSTCRGVMRSSTSRSFLQIVVPQLGPGPSRDLPPSGHTQRLLFTVWT